MPLIHPKSGALRYELRSSPRQSPPQTHLTHTLHPSSDALTPPPNLVYRFVFTPPSFYPKVPAARVSPQKHHFELFSRCRHLTKVPIHCEEECVTTPSSSQRSNRLSALFHTKKDCHLNRKCSAHRDGPRSWEMRNYIEKSRFLSSPTPMNGRNLKYRVCEVTQILPIARTISRDLR